jgi:hypothetical protein
LNACIKSEALEAKYGGIIFIMHLMLRKSYYQNWGWVEIAEIAIFTYDMILYLLTAIGFSTGGSGPYTIHK